MVPAGLLQVLRCPETGQTLSVAPPELLARVNESLRSGLIRYNAGRCPEPLEAGLIRSDGLALYPVSEDIPVLLTSEAIPLQGFRG